MLRAHARQIRIGKWLSTVRTPSNTARLLISYFYADDVMGMAYLKKNIRQMAIAVAKEAYIRRKM